MKKLIVIALVLSQLGCAAILNRASQRVSDQLNRAILNNEDPATIRDGLPAYLIMLDALAEGESPSPSTLMAAAELHSAYAGNFVPDSEPDRQKRLVAKAMRYVRRATCQEYLELCAVLDRDAQSFEEALRLVPEKKVTSLYALASVWSTYVQINRDDWGAVADLPKIEILLKRIVEVEPQFKDGMPYVYLGVLNSILPEAVGGKPDVGKAYFEKAWELSGSKNLMAKTYQAGFYARLVFDRAVHDQLLNEVLESDPVAPSFTLINTLAQEKARTLLESGDDFF